MWRWLILLVVVIWPSLGLSESVVFREQGEGKLDLVFLNDVGNTEDPTEFTYRIDDRDSRKEIRDDTQVLAVDFAACPTPQDGCVTVTLTPDDNRIVGRCSQLKQKACLVDGDCTTGQGTCENPKDERIQEHVMTVVQPLPGGSQRTYRYVIQVLNLEFYPFP